MSDPLTLTPELALQLWYIAAKQEFGIRLATNPAQVANIKSILYNARGDLGKPSAIAGLSLQIRDEGRTIWIYKTEGAKLE